MSDIEKLEARVRKLEDVLTLHNLLVEYGFAADSGDADLLSSMFTKDAVYELDDLRLEGREQIVATIVGQRDRPSMVSTAHTIGPVVIQVEGNTATARGYSRLYVRQEDESVTLWRLSFNRWEFVREGGNWRIARRTALALGQEGASTLLQVAHGESGHF